MRPLRIMHVHEKAGFFGGVERVMHDIAAGLSQRGLPQGLYHPGTDNADQAFLAPFAMAGSKKEILDEFAPDILFMHKLEDPQALTELATRFPSIRMVHDHDMVCMRRHKYLPIGETICERPAGIGCYTRLCFVGRAKPDAVIPITFHTLDKVKKGIRANRQLSRLIVGSQWMKKEMTSNGFGDNKITIIPPIPAAIDNVHPLPPANEQKILFVGQVIKGKGVDLLIRALKKVPPPWQAVIVGAGNHLDECKKLAAELGIAERIDFAGWVDHENLERYYAEASLVVVPSRWPEPFGMVGVEAMARARPVVAFAAGGIPDWLDDGVTGSLVPPGDVDGLGRAIAKIIADPKLAEKMGQAGAQRVAAQFRHNHFLDQIEETLRSLS